MSPSQGNDAYKQNESGDITFLVYDNAKRITVNLDRTALQHFLPTATGDLATIARAFESNRVVFEALAYEKYRVKQVTSIEISAVDFLFAQKALKGMCVV
jgi:hypothetical protein